MTNKFLKAIKRLFVTAVALSFMMEPRIELLAASSNINVSKSNIKYTITYDSNKNATQNFCIEGNSLYTTQRISETLKSGATQNYVKVTRFNLSSGTPSKLDEMWVKDAGHGQTLEVYTYGGKTYLLFSLKNTDSGWSVQIGRIEYKKCTKATALSYTSYDRFSDLAYSNSGASYFGKVKRVDAALSSDKNIILIWKRNESNNNEMTAYDFTTFNKTLSNSSSNYVSFKGNSSMKKKVEFSFNDKGEKNSIPSSVQGIDLSNESNNLYSIYISSGDENVDGSLYLYRLNSKGNLKAKKKITHTSFLSGVKLEIEGVHISGTKLQFLLVRSTLSGTTVDKSKQYIMNIDKSLLS